MLLFIIASSIVISWRRITISDSKLVWMTEPIEFLQLYLTSQFMNELAFQTNFYARQQVKLNLKITATELR